MSVLSLVLDVVVVVSEAVIVVVIVVFINSIRCYDCGYDDDNERRFSGGSRPYTISCFTCCLPASTAAMAWSLLCSSCSITWAIASGVDWLPWQARWW